MVKFDRSLASLPADALDTLRTLDHALCSVNYDLITAVVKHGATKAGGGGGAILVFMPGQLTANTVTLCG